MKTYRALYPILCSQENLQRAFKKARRGKTKKWYVLEFENNLEQEINALHCELKEKIYQPAPLKQFIIRDPKTREIHASAFRDRVAYHAIVNVLEPIYEKKFIYDSYASRKEKGTHKSIERYDSFQLRVSKNGQLINKPDTNNNIVGYALKADIRHYFASVDHEVLLSILRRTIKDEHVVWLIKKILDNFETEINGKGMPLGNLTSQFFANVYLNELDYFVKHHLRAKYYLRYVDDFVILHQNKKTVESYHERIICFLKSLNLELHPDKTKIIPLRNGLTFLGYRNFHYHRLLRKSNVRTYKKKILREQELMKKGLLSQEEIMQHLQGWFGYAQWANTYRLRQEIMKKCGLKKPSSLDA